MPSDWAGHSPSRGREGKGRSSKAAHSARAHAYKKSRTFGASRRSMTRASVPRRLIPRPRAEVLAKVLYCKHSLAGTALRGGHAEPACAPVRQPRPPTTAAVPSGLESKKIALQRSPPDAVDATPEDKRNASEQSDGGDQQPLAEGFREERRAPEGNERGHRKLHGGCAGGG
jgi:hypothetical protein